MQRYLAGLLCATALCCSPARAQIFNPTDSAGIITACGSSDTQVLFTSGTSCAGDANFTWTTPVLGVTGRIAVTPTTGNPFSSTGFAVNSTGVISGSTLATGSTTARTLAARAADAINVKDYGAVCDGTTDDAAAFAAANTAAASAGKAVYVPGGTCRFSTNFSLSANVDLIGDPGESILKALVTNAANPVLLALTGGNNYIYGITFDGDLGDSITNTGNVVTAFSVANVVFDTDKWQNTLGIGVIFSTSISYSGVRNSQFKSVGNFAAALASRHQNIDFCCGTATTNTNNFATNNDFFDFGLDAISLDSQYYPLVANNRFNTSGAWNGSVGVACIYLTTNHYSAITGNVCYNASGNGIDEISSFDSAITGNTVTLAGQSGISTAFDTNVAITGNSISNNNQLASATTNSGVVVFGVCANVQITGNVISDDQGSATQQYGIRYLTTSPGTGACTNLNVAGNSFAGNVVAATSTNLPGSALTSPGFAVDGSGLATSGGIGVSTGAFKLAGTTSGVITIQPQAAAGTFNFNLPITVGSSGAVLASGGGGSTAMTWTTLAASATTDTTNASNISSGTLPAARLPNPTATTLGGIESYAAVSNQWINAISTSGVPSSTQPACGNLSNAAASCSTDATNASNISSGSLAVARETAAGSNTQVQLNSSNAFAGSANLTWVSPALTIGVATSTTGVLKLTGATSGTITITGQAAAGTYEFDLPITAGSSGNFLTSAGGAGSPMTWTAAPVSATAANIGAACGSDTQVVFVDSTSCAGNAGLTFSKTPKALTITSIANPSASSLTVTGATALTTSQPVLNMTQTWVTVGTTYTGIKFNVTNTASAAGSLLMDLQVGGTSQHSVSSTGVTVFAAGSQATPTIQFTGAGTGTGFWSGGSNVISIGQNGSEIERWGATVTYNFNPDYDMYSTNGRVGFGAAPDVYVQRSAAAVLEVNNGTLGTLADLHLHHLEAGTGQTVPALSTCGAATAAAAGSTDAGGTFTTGTASTACTLTFNAAYTTNAFCTITPANTAAATNIAGTFIVTSSKTAFTITTPSVATLKYNYTCSGS